MIVVSADGAVASTIATCGGAQGARPGAATNADKPHPRLGLYGHSLGDGTPLILAGGDMNAPLIAQIARYDEVVMSVSPFTEYRSDVLAEIRRQNPGIKLYAYIQANYCWPAYQPDSLVNIPTRHYRLIRDLNGFLYKQQGGWMYDTNINIAKKSGNRWRFRSFMCSGRSIVFATCHLPNIAV